MNPMHLIALKKHWDTFDHNHPKFKRFLGAAASSGIGEGSIIEISIENPNGKNLCTNLKLTKSDLEFIQALKSMSSGQ